MHRQVELISERYDAGSYHLRAWLRNDGYLVFEGQDLGARVEDHFGYPEYEYTITLDPRQVARLMGLLGEAGDVLDAVRKHLSGDVAWRLRTWLEESAIELEFTARTGP